MIGINSIANQFSPYSSAISNASNNQGSSQVAKELKAEGKSESLAKNYASEKAAKRAGVIECETCASRKYQDGSDEQVSFKSAAHIAPEAAAARVQPMKWNCPSARRFCLKS